MPLASRSPDALTDTSASMDAALRHDSLEREFASLFRLEDEAASELVLIRHAHSQDHGSDPPLTHAGICEAAALARRLGPLWTEAVYTAPEARASQTADIIAGMNGRPVARIDDLREIDLDESASRPLAEPGRLAARWMLHPRWEALSRLEPGRSFRRRALQAIDSAIARHPGRRVIVVTHASVINAYLSALLDIPRDMFFLPAHASLTLVRSLGDLTSVQTVNDCSHLGA